MCRKELEDFDQETTPFDKSIAKIIDEKYPNALKERIIEFEKDMEEEKHKIIKKLVVGNDCRDDVKPKWKEWTLYLQMEEQTDDIGRYIDKIVVKLHPTFNPPVLEFKKPPFTVSRRGWGTFEINITLHFQEKTQKLPMDITWYISFRDGGRFKIVDLEFDDRYL